MSAGAEVASAFVALLPSARRFGSSIDGQISGDVAKSGRKAGGIFSGTFGKIASRVGPLVGAGAVAGFAKQAVGLEATFSATMNEMSAVAQVPQAELKELSDLAVKMGADTVFSANDAAAAMLELAKNGIEPATIKAGALKSALTLAAAGGVSMEEAATTMGNALNAFNLKGNQAESVAAALAGAANASSADIGSLAQGLAQAATGASQAGMSVQETTAALAAFSNAGIQGSDAGTSFKTFLQRLVPQTTKAQEAMEGLGLASYNANAAQKLLAEGGIKMSAASLKNQVKANAEIQKMMVARGDLDSKYLDTATGSRKAQSWMWITGVMDSAFTDAKGNFEGLSTISGALQKRLGKLSDSERSMALTTLFGSDAQRAAAVLMKAGTKGIEKNIAATSDQGAAHRVAASRMKGTAGAIESFKGSLETLTLRFGQLIAPAVQTGLKLLTDGLNALPGVLGKIGSAFAGGGDGPSKLAESFKSTGAAVIAFVKPLLPIIASYGKKIMATLGPALSQIGGLISTQLLPSFRKLLPVILPVAKFLLKMFGDAVIGAIKGFVQAVKGVINIVSGIFKLVVALVHGDWSGAWKAVVQIAKGAFDLIVGAIKVWWNVGILSMFKRGALALLGSFKGLWTGAKGLVTKGLASMRGAAMKGMDALGKGIGNGVKAIGRLIWSGLKAYVGLWKRLFNLVKGVVREGWTVLRHAFGGALAAIRTVVSTFVTRVIGFYAFLFRNVIRIVREGIGKAVEFFRGLPRRVLGALGNLKTKLVDKGRDIVTGLMDGIKKMGKKLADFVKKFVVDHIPGPVAKALGMASPSKVMAEQAKHIPGGMIAGIESQHHAVDEAMRRLSNRVVLHAPRLDPSVVGATTGARTTGGMSGPLFHIDKVEAQDVNHLLREMQSRARTRAGGGVTF